MSIEYFCCYHSYLEVMDQLNDAEKGRLFTACLTYSKTGEVPQLSGNERFVFPTFKAQIDRDNQRYKDRCLQQSNNAKKRWNAKGCHGMPRDATVCQRMPTYANDANTKTKTKAKTKANVDTQPDGCVSARGTRFTPPTVEQVAEYVAERGSRVDPQGFVDFYTSKGWMVGKTPMKDWKAACRNAENWERWTRQPTASERPSQPQGRVSFTELANEMGGPL